MSNNQSEILSWTEMTTRFPNEWITVGNPVFEGLEIVEGIVIAHHTDKRVASMEGGEHRANFQKFTLQFTGQIPMQKHIGLLRKIPKTT